MEIELKYSLGDPKNAERLFTDEEIRAVTDEGSDETVHMHAVYFDTEDKRLSREGMVFRVRCEDRKLVGTLKWNGHSESGMHEREEINIPLRPLRDEYDLYKPDIDIFRQSPVCNKLRKLVGKRELINVLETDFIRRQVRIDIGDAICELSVDTGRLIRGDLTGSVAEVEIELYSGDRSEMEKWGAHIAEKYGLEPENRGKFRQGMELTR